MRLLSKEQVDVLGKRNRAAHTMKRITVGRFERLLAEAVAAKNADPAKSKRGKPAKAKLPKVDYPAMLAQQIRFAKGLHEPAMEYRFDAKRKWRFDLAWPEYKIAIEIEGGIWTQGRHTRGKGYLSDMEKYNAAALQGWRVLRATPDMVKTGRALELVGWGMKYLRA